MKLAIFSSTAMLLAALPAGAATMSSVLGSFSADVTASDPAAYSFEIDTDDDAERDQDGDATASADALGTDGAVEGTITLATGATGPGFGSADATAEVSQVLFAENLGSDPLTLSFSADYILEAMIDSDLLEGDDGAAMVEFAIFANGDEIFSDALDADLQAPGNYDVADGYDFDLDLEGFGFADIEFFLSGESFATAIAGGTSPAPVPLPASGLLLLAGLGGLAVAQRRGA